jgi:hypothetical protein
MFCTNCGKQTRPRNSRCTHCGFDLAPVIALLKEPEDASDEAADKPRAADEVARRALTLAAVISCAYGDSKAEVVKWLKREKLWAATTPAERKFLLARTSAKARIAFSWKIEALVPLLWAVRKTGKMPGLAKQCSSQALAKAVVSPPHSTRDYIASSRLRKPEELSGEYEKVYRAHWRVRDAQSRGKPMPKGVDPEIVQERHYGFNWLIGYMGQPWDAVTTDT